MADTIAFDAATFDRLIAFATDIKDQIDTELLAPTGGVRLDESLSTYLKPGSSDWDVVGGLLASAGTFGGSTRTKLKALSEELGDFIQALKDAKAALMKGDDMATMSATDFMGKFPGIGGSTGATGLGGSATPPGLGGFTGLGGFGATPN